MISYNKKDCLECNASIEQKVFSYSISNYGHPLCRSCQGQYSYLRDTTYATNESSELYFALKRRGVPAKMERFDGYKTIDIAVKEAKVNIEVDGPQHVFKPKQALSDLKRTYYSFKKGYLTLRIPNALVKYNLEETANLITEYLNECLEKNKPYFAKSKSNKKQGLGFCLRCKTKLDFNPDRPFCYDCYTIWAEYENYTFMENHCHSCGKGSRTSMAKPLCTDCYFE